MYVSKRRRLLITGALTILSILITVVQPIQKAVAADICTGNGTIATISDPAGIGIMSSVTGSSALDRTSPANLVANGDFTTEPAALASSSEPNYYYWGPDGYTGGTTALVATLATGTNVITLTNGTTPHLSIGTQITSPSSTNPAYPGRLNSAGVYVESIISATQFSVKDSSGNAANHATAGEIVMYPAAPSGVSINTAIPGWNRSGGGTRTYAHWTKGGAATGPNSLIAPAINGQSAGRVYFGNKVVSSITPNPTFDSAGYSTTQYAFTVQSIYGTATTPPALDQTISLVPGTKYRLHFSQSTEDFLTSVGIAALDITGYDRTFFRVTTGNAEYYLDFVATTAQTNIKFMSWGHLFLNNIISAELVLDDVIINACTSGPPPATPAPTAVNDAQSTAWDTNQTYSPLTNDSADASTSLDSTTFKLCPVGTASPYNATSCSQTSITVAGQGVYTISGSSVTFNPDATFFGVVSTPVRYVIADALGQYASAIITPTIGPKATPDTLSLAAGASATFAAITGSGGLATGAALNTSGTFLCGAGEIATACTATSVTIAGVGVYTLNQSTGVVTLAADAGATAGTKAALTYVVADSTGLKASSTLTPTIAVLPPVPTAVNDAQSSAWDVNQTYSPMSNDSSDTSTVLSNVKFKLCPVGVTAPYNGSNCDLTSLTISGQGVYTLSGTTVVFNPDATFFGTVSTPARYVIADGFNQYASAVISPTIGPKATPDTLSLAAGATASFRAITGSGGLATGASLNTSRTYLCGTGQTAPNCTETATVTVAAVGIYTLNQTTGVVTLVADANATPGTKASLTYVVTDSTGMTASSTLTPTIPAPSVPVVPTPVTEPTPPPLSVASPDITSDFRGKVHSINLLTNDKPGTGLTLDATSLKFCALTETVPNCTATSVTITGQGAYAVGLGGVVTFTPEANFVGTATALPYVVKDSYGRTINATYTPTVRDFPIANPNESTGPFRQTQRLSILENDKASTGATLVAGTVRLCALTETPPNCTASSVEIPNQGVFLLGADGVVTFTPTKTFTGTATTIKYQVADNSGQIASSTITVIVGPAPLPPKAIDDFRTTPMNVAVSLDPTPNDIAGTFPLVAKTVRLCTASEVIGQCASTSVTNTTGTFTVNTATGIVTFTPAPGWTGVTKVPYIVLDTFGLIAPAYITVTINPPAYLKLKELAWTGPKTIGPAKKKLAIPASSAGTGSRIATMRIPSLGSSWRQSVLHGISDNNLKKDLGYYPGSALPGAIGNFAVAGHRMTNEQPFRDLDKLNSGDPIVIQVGKKIYVYTVVGSKIAKPTDVREIYPVPGNPSAIATKAMLTLTTCHPKNSAKERLIVNAVLDSVYDLATAPEKYKAKS